MKKENLVSDAINYLQHLPGSTYAALIIIAAIIALYIYYNKKQDRESKEMYDKTLIQPVQIDDSHVNKTFAIRETDPNNPGILCIEEVVWISTDKDSFDRNDDENIYAPGYFKDIDYKFWMDSTSIKFSFTPEVHFVFEVLRDKNGYCGDKVVPKLVELEEDFVRS